MNVYFLVRQKMMTSRERIRRIIAGEPADRCGFWLGNPHDDTLPIYHKYFGTSSLEEIQLKLGDDFRWITPLFIKSSYRHPVPVAEAVVVDGDALLVNVSVALAAPAACGLNVTVKLVC